MNAMPTFGNLWRRVSAVGLFVVLLAVLLGAIIGLVAAVYQPQVLTRIVGERVCFEVEDFSGDVVKRVCVWGERVP